MRTVANPDAPELFGLPESEEERRRLLEEPLDEGNRKWAGTLAEYVRVLEALFIRRGMAAEEALKLAMDATLELGQYHGGQVIYLPRGDALRTALQHAEIFRRSRRGNIEGLAREYGLSVPQIYRVVRQQLALHRGRVQGTLWSVQAEGHLNGTGRKEE